MEPHYALRDAETRMDAITRAAPVHPVPYLSARFLGALAVACLTFLGAAVGWTVVAYMPWVPADSIGPFHLSTYVIPFLVIAVPNIFVTGAVFFAVATATRSLLATYLCSAALFVIYIVMRSLSFSGTFRSLRHR